MYKTLKLLLVVIAFGIFVYKAYVFLDPDFGWHYRMGEVITNTGIPKTDPFSYTMASFPFVDHEWLTNKLVYFSYDEVGIFGLSLLFALVAFLAVFLAAKNNILLFLLATSAIIPFFGVRPQVQSWFYLSFLYLLLTSHKYWSKLRLLMPLFMLFWANMHGSYAIGVATLALFLVAKMARLKRVEKADLIVIVFSVFATLVNPYGIGLWREAWMQFTDTNLRWSITEWMPAVFSFNFPFMALIALSGVFIWIYRTSLHLEKKVLYLVFLIQAISSVRHVPLFVIIATPITLEAFKYFVGDLKKIKFGISRLRKGVKFALIGSLAIFAVQAYFALRGGESLSENSFYPKEAVVFLKENDVCGRLFNDYGWGGYLIWKLPSEKLFIDGRMPSWRWNASLPTEANWAMKEYSGVLSGENNLEKVFAKHGIGTVLVPVDRPESLFSKFARKIENIFNKEKPYKFKEDLVDKGWLEVFNDGKATIFKHPDCPLEI